MKRIHLIVLFNCIFITVQSQTSGLYYDALNLYQDIDPSTQRFALTPTIMLKDWMTILNSYLPEDIQKDNWNPIDLVGEFNSGSNEMIKKRLPTIADMNAAGISSGIAGVSLNKIGGAIKSFGNLDVTNFADGLAKFLVERAKEELNVAFFRQFQEYIKKYPEVFVIFPETYGILSKLYSFQLTAFLPALRASFQKDMNSFSANLIKLRNLAATSCPPGNTDCVTRIGVLNNFLRTDPVGKTFVAALIVSDNLVKGNNVAEILDAISNDEICMDQSSNFTNIIRFSNLVSKSLRSNIEGEIWVSKTEINKLISNDDAFKIYLGLLYAKNNMEAPSISFTLTGGGRLLLNDLLVEANDNLAGYYAKFKTNFKDVAFAAADVSSNARHIISDQNGGNQGSILVYADYAGSISNYLKFLVSFFNDKNPQLTNDVKLFTIIIDDAVNACYDIKSQNYTSLVLHTSNMLNSILNGNYPFKEDYIKYGTFMANIVEADNSDEVKAAIEAAVLPVGSSSIKRETNVNISVNAFLGPMVGREYLPTLEEDQWATVVGITAPVGVAISLGNIGNGRRNTPPTVKTCCKGKEVGGKSLTLFIPIIDVGAITTFRLGNDSTNVASDIKLENIIAPGVYLYWGLGKGPLSIGAGCQVGPQLREINATEINIDKNIYFRYGINIAVDIPFFNFYTKN